MWPVDYVVLALSASRQCHVTGVYERELSNSLTGDHQYRYWLDISNPPEKWQQMTLDIENELVDYSSRKACNIAGFHIDSQAFAVKTEELYYDVAVSADTLDTAQVVCIGNSLVEAMAKKWGCTAGR